MNAANAKKLSYVGSRDAQTKSLKERIRDSDSWFTPAPIIAAAKNALGGIGLDPFSSAEANAKVGAEHILTEKDDAFTCAWPKTSSAWMNPPYGRGLVDRAVARFLVEYYKDTFKRGIVLVNNATETRWFQSLLADATALCIPQQRIAFENVDGKNVSGNTRGQIIFLFESDNRVARASIATFRQSFAAFGPILEAK